MDEPAARRAPGAIRVKRARCSIPAKSHCRHRAKPLRLCCWTCASIWSAWSLGEPPSRCAFCLTCVRAPLSPHAEAVGRACGCLNSIDSRQGRSRSRGREPASSYGDGRAVGKRGSGRIRIGVCIWDNLNSVRHACCGLITGGIAFAQAANPADPAASSVVVISNSIRPRTLVDSVQPVTVDKSTPTAQAKVNPSPLHIRRGRPNRSARSPRREGGRADTPRKTQPTYQLTSAAKTARNGNGAAGD